MLKQVRDTAIWLLNGLAFVVLLLGLAVTVVPRAMGGEAYTVMSGSMQPAINAGDLILTVPQETYAVGDVVTYRPADGVHPSITHRVVGVAESDGQTWYTTRGDANGAADVPIRSQQVLGKVAYSLPHLGEVRYTLGEAGPIGLAVLTAGLIGYGAALVVRDLRGGKKPAVELVPSPAEQDDGTAAAVSRAA